MAACKTPIYFGSFLVTSQVFHLTAHSFALVNLKPLLPGHVLVSPRRKISRLSELNQVELADLFATVQRVGRMVERVYDASSLNIAIQDGADAGQSVPHMHTHIIPRKKSDLDNRGGSDAIYGMLEDDDGNIGKHQYDWVKRRPKFPTIHEDDRGTRSEADMAQEATMLAKEMQITAITPPEKL